MNSDSNKPFVIGMIVLACLMVIGIGYAVSMQKSGSSGGRYDANVSFNDDGDPVTGNMDAQLVIRMFEDFECPACKLGKAGIDHVRQTYGDKVKIVWNDFPLESVHPKARLSANAGRCAEEQGKFWEFSDALYNAQSQWVAGEVSQTLDLFGSYAERLGMNRSVFEGCLDEKRYNFKIDNDIKESLANRVDSTPTFFIGNDRFTGAMTNAQWDTEIQKRLGK